MNKKIFYFSGTGNSMRAAQKIATYLGNTEIISIKSDNDNFNAEDCDVIGFIFPVHHWTLPEPVVNFVKELKMNNNAYIFCIAMPSFVCGCACEKLEEILISKHVRISYGAKVYNVANYCIVYPPVPPAKLVIPKVERKLDKISKDISERKIQKIPRANWFVRKKIKKTMEKYKDVLNYADMGFKISERCISCGTCVKVCPMKNIEIIDKKPIFKNKCVQCMACVSFCPKKAIEYKLNEEDLKAKNIDTSKVKIIKIMKLPKKRKCYHNPYITAMDISKYNIFYK